jgi:4'-phosphopantetheinyl transferase
MAQIAAAPQCTVWLARLDQLRPGHDALLTSQEAARAAYFRLAADRSRFVLGTALLRCAVAQRLGISAAAVQLDRSCPDCGRQHGRPLLPGTNLEASIAHSGDLVAVALTEGQPVGVDVEENTHREYVSLLDYVCAPSERPHVTSRAAFYRYWTRKEAVLKATGAGLRTPMTSVLVSPPDEPATVVGHEPWPIPGGCGLTDLNVPAGYTGALAILTERRPTINARDPAAILA